MLTPDGVCWFGDPGRLQAPRFLASAADRGFRVRILDANGRPRSQAGTEFQILELQLPPG
jgi:hypothetical protein